LFFFTKSDTSFADLIIFCIGLYLFFVFFKHLLFALYVYFFCFAGDTFIDCVYLSFEVIA